VEKKRKKKNAIKIYQNWKIKTLTVIEYLQANLLIRNDFPEPEGPAKSNELGRGYLHWSQIVGSIIE